MSCSQRVMGQDMDIKGLSRSFNTQGLRRVTWIPPTTAVLGVSITQELKTRKTSGWSRIYVPVPTSSANVELILAGVKAWGLRIIHWLS